MGRNLDQDGKSKTASAVDEESYPEQNEVAAESHLLTAEQIRDRAHELWDRRGRPQGTSEQDWLEAERELNAELRADLVQQRKLNGSVQP